LADGLATPYDPAMSDARALWKRIETIHAVTYFSPESVDAAKQAGLQGFWMGYFGFRAAPLGAVTPGVIEATFANFARSMIERAIPDAWTFATPEDLVDVRAEAAAATLRRLAPDTLDEACTAPLDAVIGQANALGRPLFAANRRLAPRADPVEALWQACTTLREHRGDGHVAALSAHQVDGCEAHRLHAAAHGTPHEVLQHNRGFTDQQWSEAGNRLAERGFLDGHRLTPAGHDLVVQIESLTDELAQQPIDLAGVELASLIDPLESLVWRITDSRILPFPNPMGLPAD